MENFLQNIRFGFRSLFKNNTAFTVVALLTLALGISATTCIFSVVNSILLRPLPYQDPNHLVVIHQNNLTKGLDLPRVSQADFIDWKNQNPVFERIAAVRYKTFLLTGGSEPEWVNGGAVSADLFSLLGIQPILGQTFDFEEDQPAHSNIVVISYGLWQRNFSRNQNIIGQSVTLDNQSYVVAGVMPPDFDFPKKFDVWIPLTINAGSAYARKARFLYVIARLKKEIRLEQAQTQMNTIVSQLEQTYPDTNAGWGVKLIPLVDETIGNTGRVLIILLGAVGFVLLIACTNVANLLLARAVVREKDLAIRIALGAGRRQLIQYLLTESLLLSLIGGVIGFLLSIWAIHFLVSLAPSDMPRLTEVSIDSRVFAFTLVLSLLTGVVFGLVPSLAASKPDLSCLLKEGSQRLSGGKRGNRLLKALMIFEVALALVLLTGAGLMIKSFIRLQNVDPGFNSTNVLTLKISLPASKYPEANKQRIFFQQLLEQIAELPTVKESSATTELPIGGSNSAFPVSVEGQPQVLSGDQPIAFYNAISSNYFRAMGIPLMNGRYFNANDEGESSSKVIIIDETMANRFFPDEDPIGKRLIVASGKPTPYEVIGIVNAIKFHGLDLNSTIPAMYVPYLQLPQAKMTLVISSTSTPTSLASAVRDIVRRLDKEQPISQIYTMEQLLSESLSQKRFYTLLLTVFAVISLFLASAGIYGVMSYSITQRTHEIGIRMALGARQIDIIKLIIRQNFILIIIGALVGLAGAFALTRFLSNLLYEVTATDPSTFAIVVTVLLATALLACYIPAQKATALDPMIILRQE